MIRQVGHVRHFLNFSGPSSFVKQTSCLLSPGSATLNNGVYTVKKSTSWRRTPNSQADGKRLIFRLVLRLPLWLMEFLRNWNTLEKAHVFCCRLICICHPSSVSLHKQNVAANQRKERLREWLGSCS
jgi:hypothetical protein